MSRHVSISVRSADVSRPCRSGGLRAALLSGTALSMTLFMGAGPGRADPVDCPATATLVGVVLEPVSGDQTCTVTDDTPGDTVNVKFPYDPGTPFVDSEDMREPDSYTVDNQKLLSDPDLRLILVLDFLAMPGGTHDSDGNGYPGQNGNPLVVTNSGTVSLSQHTGTDNYDIDGYGDVENDNGIGLFDNSGVVMGIAVRNQGGTGDNAPETTVGGGNGGDGGNGGSITITNSGSVQNGYGTATSGAVGIYAGALGGIGGKQDKSATYAQKGGDGGNGGPSDGLAVDITNSGTVDLTYTASRFVYGIGAESLGGTGIVHEYDGNGAVGGNGEAVRVANSGSVTLTVSRATTPDHTALDLGVRGISAVSQGGVGNPSNDGDRNGANGGHGGSVLVVNTNAVTVSGSGIAEINDNDGVSGALVGISQGGAGGGSDNTRTNTTDQTGGLGGAASGVQVYSAGQVSTTGDNLSLPGITAMSVGGDGGGGNGDGFGGNAGQGGTVKVAVTGSISTGGAYGHGVYALSQGGTGGMQWTDDGPTAPNHAVAGAGGAAGDVRFVTGDAADQIDTTVTGSIFTSGAHANGVLLQSMGGLGGYASPGFKIAGKTSTDAGIGGDAGTVTVDNTAAITTTGAFSNGILAQSIGGGGGNVGESSGGLTVSGDGGTGAASGTVDVTQRGDITTTQDSSVGIQAQSISGGGGRVAGSTGVISVGGTGGSSPKAGNASVTLAEAAVLTTSGDYSYGLHAQSVGGGGGDGGSVFDVSAGLPAVAVGGSGGAAGDGGNATVTVQDTARVVTHGMNAHGMMAQSVGGGGGSGGDANAYNIGLGSYSIAGGGGSSGDAATAQAVMDGGAITTTGGHANGVVALSVGGGGGSGGSATSFSADAMFTMAIGAGGTGGAAGKGGAAVLDLSGGTILTGDDTDLNVTDAHGAVAISVGGGGGMGGSASSKAVSVSIPSDEPQVDGEVSLAVGGDGKGGGDGGNVTATLTGQTITTLSDSSTGLVAISAGGGGGMGGDASAAGTTLTLPKTGEEKIQLNINIAVGGSTEGGGDGGDVTATLGSGSTITTRGDFSNGVHMLSIGGGGGAGGTGSAEKFTLEIPSGNQEGEKNEKKLSGSAYFTAGVGGTGGAGGNGGHLTYSQSADSTVLTYGQASKGVFLNAVGGGGGASQSATVGFGTDKIPATVDLFIGRTGAGGGDGGEIDSADLAGTIATYGADSDAVLIHSVGGGGGAGGSAGGAGADESGLIKELNEIKEDLEAPVDIRFTMGGKGGAGGIGGMVSGVTFSGDIATYGDFSEGIVLQSIGGGGGTGGAAQATTSISVVRSFVGVGGSGGTGGSGGFIRASLDGGTIVTGGVAAHGLVAQSVGGGGGLGGDASRAYCKKLNLGGGYLAKGLADLAGSDVEITPNDLCAELPSIYTLDGEGGALGNGGAIEITGDAGIGIATTGAFAHGVLLQSIGGGGGSEATGNSYDLDPRLREGTDNPNAGDFSYLDRNTVQIDLGAAGTGGDTGGSAGAGGSITLDSVLQVSTAGDGAAGVIGQSVGGGGGVGTVNGIAGVGMGGQGTRDAAGGSVSLTFETGSTIGTSGNAAPGILAQSVSNGGGYAAGGLAAEGPDENGNNIRVGLGATARENQSGGTVEVVFHGRGENPVVSTRGMFSRAIIAQSLGGGGGLFSMIDGVTSGPQGVDTDVSMGTGANGAGMNGSGTGGGATVTLYGSAYTQGDGADAVLVQSAGGGGGIVDLAPAAGAADTPSYALGSTGGNTVNALGGAARLGLQGSEGVSGLHSSGDAAYGALVQSLGAGGGVLTSFQSVGRGAGLVLGSSASAPTDNGGAGTATVSNFTSLHTTGDDAHGIVAQSVGGGGGVMRLSDVMGGDARLGSVATANGTGGTGGAVSVTMGFYDASGTSGDRAIGILAQSVSNGGGILSTGGGALDSITFGSAGTARHGAGNVAVTLTANTGRLATSGSGAHGIVAQSVGGGGGIGGDIDFSDGIFLTAGDWELYSGRFVGDRTLSNVGLDTGKQAMGSGGDVTVSVSDDVTTTGSGAYGVIAQSIGGAGGFGGSGTGGVFAGKLSNYDVDGGSVTNAGGSVTVSVAAGATVSATGRNAVGLFAQSLGDIQSSTGVFDPRQNLAVSVEGTVVGGTGNAAYGVLMHGGSAGNTLDVGAGGYIGTTLVPGQEQIAVRYVGETSDTLTALAVTNAGHIHGSVLGSYANGETFIDQADADDAAGPAAASFAVAAAPARRRAALTLTNAEGGLLTGAARYEADVVNAGTMHIGAVGGMDTLAIAGDYTQADSGEMVAAVDFMGLRGDLLSIGGDASFGGTLTI
uniref:hypothetical protein n=1 Tax=Oceanicella sp. SM1341 TaxID=1548889 RepID=UPI000E50B328